MAGNQRSGRGQARLEEVRMPRGKDLDHLAIHRVLYERADRLGRVLINQTDLAKELGITKFTMSRTITQMIADHRLHQISRKKNLRGVFRVIDPHEWQDLHGPDEDQDE
jgi:hypothetical protein